MHSLQTQKEAFPDTNPPIRKDDVIIVLANEGVGVHPRTAISATEMVKIFNSIYTKAPAEVIRRKVKAVLDEATTAGVLERERRRSPVTGYGGFVFYYYFKRYEYPKPDWSKGGMMK
jgi:hypothetical protein